MHRMLVRTKTSSGYVVLRGIFVNHKPLTSLRLYSVLSFFLRIVEVVCKDMELSTLCAALTDSSKNKDVNKWLTNPKKRHTVFAPTDAAFAALPKNYDANLKFHIAKGRASFARDLSCVAGNNLVTMSNGKDTRTKCKEEVPYIQQGKGNTEMDLYPEFIESDIIACNGLIHKISNVMLLNPKN